MTLAILASWLYSDSNDDQRDLTLDSTHIPDFHGRLNSDSTHLSQSQVEFDSRLMNPAQPCSVQTADGSGRSSSCSQTDPADLPAPSRRVQRSIQLQLHPADLYRIRWLVLSDRVTDWPLVPSAGEAACAGLGSYGCCWSAGGEGPAGRWPPGGYGVAPGCRGGRRSHVSCLLGSSRLARRDWVSLFNSETKTTAGGRSHAEGP